MAEQSGTDPGAEGGVDTRLVCLTCGRVVPFTDADLLNFIQTGWPRCCGETMTLAREESDAGKRAGANE